MAKSFLLTYLIALVVFGVDARRNIAVLKCGNSRIGVVDVNEDNTLEVPASCSKGQVQWHYPDPASRLNLQFQRPHPSYCFTSRYPRSFAKYSVIEDYVPMMPYRDNEQCISTSYVQLAVATTRRTYVIFADFELEP
ncbi:uncharacterized protein LOC125657958 [Ostrea edulis]|uniref:uncharacterized protein LOC125657958 n=1 Tax=Ostrea edulis TaxID=37623 RepID=UPI0024AED91F|nr:uncharacterized protein LOC125657958 [Ostrea edulis]